MFVSIYGSNYLKTPTHISVNISLPSERKTLVPVEWKYHVMYIVCWPLAYWHIGMYGECVDVEYEPKRGRKILYMFGIKDNFESHLAIHTIQ